MKKALALAATILALPAAAQSQSMFDPGPALPGFYVGVEGGVNWLLSSRNYSFDTGYAVGAKIGYDFVGPRVEVEGVYRNNGARVPVSVLGQNTFANGSTFGPPTTTVSFTNTYTATGTIDQIAVMANLLYDFIPGATITPYIGGGAGIAFVTPSIPNSCSMCSTQFAYQAILGLSWNVSESIRINLDGRYFGTTNGGLAFDNNNITAMLGVTYKFVQAAAAAPPPPMAPQAPSFMVFFDWDRSNLSAQALATIKQAANAYKAKGNARITATGHTDSSGPEGYNMALSLRRANAVKDALVREGVPPTVISVVGRGETQLLVQTGDGVREPQNRRVEIVIQ